MLNCIGLVVYFRKEIAEYFNNQPENNKKNNEQHLQDNNKTKNTINNTQQKTQIIVHKKATVLPMLKKIIVSPFVLDCGDGHIVLGNYELMVKVKLVESLVRDEMVPITGPMNQMVLYKNECGPYELLETMYQLEVDIGEFIKNAIISEDFYVLMKHLQNNFETMAEHWSFVQTIPR
ncbi:hypothetical protein DLAC_06878 [Tieghemostelium lacteum]|uniref:Uncharacterized protein n=1 Tax=Tieghemostelium lacteum TaxID=361077 RepID=A0A151ZDL2_TIELA|nr:hypothetical protein DLAC_06878 [Tieghemostelium lacteum]|eukprot:KYQ92046.1 hypothetical protein DLAC_06878 [Tieghemostelium lacteum]